MSAIISDCGLYRFRLERQVGSGILEATGSGKTIAYFGVNPSRADALQDDATIRKMIGFSKLIGATRIIVGNAFAYRAPDVRQIRSHYIMDLAAKEKDILAAQLERERQHWHGIIDDADIVIPCWGDSKKVPAAIRGRFAVLADVLQQSSNPALCLGLTNEGDPKHPLWPGYDTPLIDWRKAIEAYQHPRSLRPADR